MVSCSRRSSRSIDSPLERNTPAALGRDRTLLESAAGHLLEAQAPLPAPPRSGRNRLGRGATGRGAGGRAALRGRAGRMPALPAGGSTFVGRTRGASLG